MNSYIETSATPFKLQGFYSYPGWHDTARDYEVKLGIALARDFSARHAAQATLRRLYEVLYKDYVKTNPNISSVEAKRNVSAAFFLDDYGSAGQVGVHSLEEQSERLDGLMDGALSASGPSVRELMTAIYNAAYFRSGLISRSRENPAMQDISLKSTIRNIWLTGEISEERRRETALQLNLNVRHLEPYIHFIRGDLALAHLRTVTAMTPVGYNYASDPYALGNLSYYSGAKNAAEVSISQWARIPRRDPQDKKRDARDYKLLGLPLSQAELAFIRSDRVSVVTLDGFDCVDVTKDLLQKINDGPSGSDFTKLRGDALKEKGVLDLQLETKVVSGATQISKVIKVVAKKVTAVGLGASLTSDGEFGPDLLLPWDEGSAIYEMDTGNLWYSSVTAAGFPVATGISGTTTRMLATFGWLNVPDCDPKDFIAALLGWMLPGCDHSFYEIARGAQIAILSAEVEGKSVGSAEVGLMKQETLFGAKTEELLNLLKGSDCISLYRSFHENYITVELNLAESNELHPKRLCEGFYTGVAKKSGKKGGARQTSPNDVRQSGIVFYSIAAQAFPEECAADLVEALTEYLNDSLASICKKLKAELIYQTLNNVQRRYIILWVRDKLIPQLRDDIKNNSVKQYVGGIVFESLEHREPLWKAGLDGYANSVIAKTVPAGDHPTYKTFMNLIIKRSIVTRGVEAVTDTGVWLKNLHDHCALSGAPLDAAKVLLEKMTQSHVLALRTYTQFGHVLLNGLLTLKSWTVTPLQGWDLGVPNEMAMRKMLMDIVQAKVDLFLDGEASEYFPYVLSDSPECKVEYGDFISAMDRVDDLRIKMKSITDVTQRKMLDNDIKLAVEEMNRSVEAYSRAIERIPIGELISELKMHVDWACDAVSAMPACREKLYRGDWSYSGAWGIIDYLGYRFGTYGKDNVKFTTLASTSLLRDKASGFASRLGSGSGKKAVLCEIDPQGIPAAYIARFSEFDAEEEVLLMPGTLLKVTGRRQEGDMEVVTLGPAATPGRRSFFGLFK
ncbi:hypothetical protein [Streptomyces wuyuanensis]|uniref:hypothetical protein n=1 Tax=Streptomyces wuyuanensis TaxID=1196353 RepID=UPI003419D6D4